MPETTVRKDIRNAVALLITPTVWQYVSPTTGGDESKQKNSPLAMPSSQLRRSIPLWCKHQGCLQGFLHGRSLIRETGDLDDRTLSTTGPNRSHQVPTAIRPLRVGRCSMRHMVCRRDDDEDLTIDARRPARSGMWPVLWPAPSPKIMGQPIAISSVPP